MGTIIFHITGREDWQRARAAGEYRGPSLETEGFIHCSTQEQVQWVADRFYKGRRDLVLLCIDVDRVRPEVRYEAASTGARFPHVYGPLNVDAVVEAVEIEWDAAGVVARETREKSRTDMA